MPVIGTFASLLLFAFSSKYRSWYAELAPKLLRAWLVVLSVLTIAWVVSLSTMLIFNRPLLQGPLVWSLALGSYVLLTEMIWLSGPGMGGLYSLREKFGRFSGVLALVFASAFGVLTYFALKLKEQGAGQFSWKDASIRIGAISTGVLLLGCLLSLAVPYVLNQLERSSFAFFVGARHVRADKSGFLTAISLLSIMGVALSSCTLSSTTAVMGGFSADLKRKILGNNAHVVVDVEAGTSFNDYEAALSKVRKVPRVAGATGVVSGEVMISSTTNLAGVFVRGIDTESFPKVIDLPATIKLGKFEYLDHPEALLTLGPEVIVGLGSHGEEFKRGNFLRVLEDSKLSGEPLRAGIIIGRELAKTLHVYLGDEVTLVSPIGDLGPMGIMPRTRKFRIAAVFYTGMYEYDANLVYIKLGEAQSYFDSAGKVSVINVKVDDAEHMEDVSDQVASTLGRTDLRTRDWREINKNLFSALKLEKFAMSLVLIIAIAVASFCIICTLLLMVTEKTKEIAILKAIGATDRAILTTFMVEGIIIGAIGTVFGVATGLALCQGVSWFGLRLDPDVYYIDKLPISVNPYDFLTVAIASMFICTLATVYPAYAASRLRPIDGLRAD
jgi:lipoprotein-releasing system permease protein